MLLAHFAAMFVLMYAMVDGFGDVFVNVNHAYMAAMMAAPMPAMMVLLSPPMHPDKRLNAAVIAGSAALLALFFYLTRGQAAVGDGQFLRSMIPHHSSAVLMCEKSSITDPEIAALCAKIVESQKREIGEMKALLERRQPRALGKTH